VHGERHGEAAGQEQGGIQPAEPKIQMSTRRLERRTVGRGVDQDREEEAAEQPSALWVRLSR
jgi:hypothetical protein